MHIQVLCLLSLTFLNFKIILSFKLSFLCSNLILANYQRSLIRFLLKHLANVMKILALHLDLLSIFQKFEQIMANLIFDLMDLNYGMNSMKDSSVLPPFNLKKRTNFAFR